VQEFVDKRKVFHSRRVKVDKMPEQIMASQQQQSGLASTPIRPAPLPPQNLPFSQMSISNSAPYPMSNNMPMPSYKWSSSVPSLVFSFFHLFLCAIRDPSVSFFPLLSFISLSVLLLFFNSYFYYQITPLLLLFSSLSLIWINYSALDVWSPLFVEWSRYKCCLFWYKV